MVTVSTSSILFPLLINRSAGKVEWGKEKGRVAILKMIQQVVPWSQGGD